MTKRGGITVMLVTGLCLLVAGTAAAQKGMDTRLKRQIGVMERILDEVLVESPNLLVHSSQPTNGLYLDEYGVVFLIEASFANNFEDWKNMTFGSYSIEQDDDGNITIIRKGKGKGNEEQEELDEEEADMAWEKVQEKRQTEQYANGKKELIDAVLDYGETLSALGGSQYVTVALFLDKEEFFGKDETTHLVIKAKMDDLRSLSAQRLSREAMEKKLSIEEY